MTSDSVALPLTSMVVAVVNWSAAGLLVASLPELSVQRATRAPLLLPVLPLLVLGAASVTLVNVTLGLPVAGVMPLATVAPVAWLVTTTVAPPQPAGQVTVNVAVAAEAVRLRSTTIV
jgi:hypothetical protein